MGGNITAAAATALLFLLAGSACAVNARSGSWEGCQVVGAEKLSAESGGADAVCAAIRQAADAQGLAGDFAVEVNVLSPSMLSATVIAPDGRRLPEQRFASPDRKIGRSSLDRFARSLVRVARDELF